MVEIRNKPGDDTDETVETDDGSYEVVVGYCNNIAHCFKLITDKEGRENRCTTLDGYVKHLIEVQKTLSESLKSFEKLMSPDDNFEKILTQLAQDEDPDVETPPKKRGRKKKEA